MNVNCKLVPKGEKMLIGKGVVENLAGVPLLEIELPLFDNFHQFIKRSFDIFLSSILIFLSIPVHLYFLLLKQYDREKIWSVNGSQSEIIRYRSSSKLIQDISLLFMILNGTLSFVGSQIINASSTNPQFIVKPGVTGLPHLKAVNIDMNYIRKFENYYAMQYSLIFDIEILLKSIFKI
jgi:lipopolysaccharide/colanic/teichoic acid biosynthesis glycosyltransferase